MSADTPGAPDSVLLVVLGATGDLARRKLVPALYHLATSGQLGERTRIVGAARDTDQDDASFGDWVLAAVEDATGAPPDEATRAFCAARVHYQSVPNDEAYADVARRIAQLEEQAGLEGRRVFFLALPPKAFPGVIRALGKNGLHRSEHFTRIVIEKPFGSDLASAQELNELVHEWFDEDQVYRIDHFLGKETVQNLLVFRFANTIFEDAWNRERIDSVQITVAEDSGAGHRAAFYEETGALRDMVQNHMAQLVALVAMEPPSSYAAEPVRFEKQKVLRAVAPITARDAVFGQYTAGRSGEQDVPGYRQEPGVDPSSSTETFVALCLAISNWRWNGVPFLLRTGKRMARRLTRITIAFKRPPVSLFESLGCGDMSRNVLVITLQPDEGFSLYFDLKRPGEPLVLDKTPLDFHYSQTLVRLPDAYETLLADVIEGDQTLFVHAAEVEESWRMLTPLLEHPPEIRSYVAGSWGPAESQLLAQRVHDRWRNTDADFRRIGQESG